MRQFAISTLDIQGRFVATSQISRGAIRAGLKVGDIIGSRVWDYTDAKDAQNIEKHFARCLIYREVQKYPSSSTIGNTTEHWECMLLPCHGAEVLAIGREILQPGGFELSVEERQMLRMLADDHSVDEIAAELSISASTAASRLARLREKCGLKTNCGLVAWSLRYGML